MNIFILTGKTRGAGRGGGGARGSQKSSVINIIHCFILCRISFSHLLPALLRVYDAVTFSNLDKCLQKCLVKGQDVEVRP